MHGCCSTSVLLVNAEVYSMGGVVEGVGTPNRTSPRQAAIQKFQAELRQEYDVREERKRELEFLEKGGNPLDFNVGSVGSVSVQSTSYTDQNPAQIVTSEAKGSFAVTTSAHGDSVESSGDRNSLHPNRNNIVPSEQSSQMEGSHKALELGDSGAFSIPRKSYKRRYRSRPNRDGPRPSSADVNSTHGSHASFVPSRQAPKDVKGLVADPEDLQLDRKLDNVKVVGSTSDLNDAAPQDTGSGTIASRKPLDELPSQQSIPGGANTNFQLNSNGPEAIQIVEEMASAVDSNAPKRAKSCQINGFCSTEDGMPSSLDNSASHGIKGSDFDVQTSLSIDRNENDTCTKMETVESKGTNTNQNLIPDSSLVIESGEFMKDKKEAEITSTVPISERLHADCHQVQNGSKLHSDEELDRNGSLKDCPKDHTTIEGMEARGPTGSESDGMHTDLSGQNPAPENETCNGVGQQDFTDAKIPELPNAGLLTRVSVVSAEAETSKLESKMTDVVDEDSILEEAAIIEAKRKRLVELSMITSPTEMRQKSQWDYVLEEMAWLANDFAQERIWKVSAASRICCQAAFTSRLRKQEQFTGLVGKKVAHTLAKSVMEFWHSAEEKCKEFEPQSQKDTVVSIQAYAMRFLKHNKSNIFHDQAEMPPTPDRISDLGTLDLSWEDSLTEENLFYSIPPGAMEAYRISIESYVDMHERVGGSVQVEVETSPCDAVADFEFQDNVYYEDDVETSTYDVAVESSMTSRFGQRKRKEHPFGPRSYAVGSNLFPAHSTENKRAILQPTFLAKRPGSSLNVSIPTKRVRTASRRVISPFTAGTSGYIQFPNKTDASSGDTDSFQDDQSTLRGGSLVPNTFDTESVGDFANQLPFDSAEVSMKPKKKKKPKHLNVERWQANSGFQHEQFQRDHPKRKTESSNCSSGLLGQMGIKKPKIMRQSHDNSFNNITPTSGSVPSPAASQMSNMSNPNKFIKMLGGRDRGRKSKAHKVVAGQRGSGCAWSKFEEQALVVLVHDLGPHWEFVSDVFNNSTFPFKSIFRKAQECKEHHRLLVDKSSGDGADSAEDSGSSQPYPSTLPGIPKGTAIQLFRQLQGPIEDDTLKSHFEKITAISQKLQSRKPQDPVPVAAPHKSHGELLSNLNAGTILTPLDLCAATIAGPDIVSPGYQGPHSSGLNIPSDAAVTPIYPVSGSQNMMLGNNLSSPPGSFSSSVSRDGRYGVPRVASSAEDQQRMQQYNYMASNRNLPQSNITAPGPLPGIDRGMRIRPGISGMGIAVNRTMATARPGFASSPMVNSGSMVPPAMTPATMNSGVGSSQGSSTPRPREASHIMRSALHQDSQRKMAGPDVQMPGNSQGVSHFGGLSSAPNQTGSPSYTVHHQPPRSASPLQPQVLNPHHPHFQGPTNHVPTQQQQAYAIHLAKERQMHHRSLPQQLASSNSLMPSHSQTQPQNAASSPVQSSSQVHAQTSSQVSLSPSTPSSSLNSMSKQKHPKPTQTGKQRQKQQQQLSQSNRKHPQQAQAQQQGKIAKGVGKGNLKMNQNIPIDPSLSNGISANPVNQPANLVQGLGSYSGSIPQAVQPKRHNLSSQSSNNPLPQQNMYPGPALKRPDTSTPGHIPSISPSVSTGHQSIPSVSIAGLNHQQAASHQKLMNQNQLPIQRVVAPNRQINPELSNKPQARESDADLHLTSSSVEMDTELALPQACTSATTAVRIVSPAKTHQVQPPDHLLDSKTLSSAENQSPLASQPQHHPPVQHEQPVPMLHSHQQTHLLQAGNGNLYGRPSDPGLE